MDLDSRSCPLPSFDKKQYVTLRGYRQKNGALDMFPIADDVLYLSLNFSNLSSFKGIGRLRNLRRLELSHCYKLVSDIGIDEVADSIRHLHIENSKKFTFGSHLKTLSKIEVLRLHACGGIDNREFLHAFPNLIDFRFVDTNIKGGDLSPLLKHKTLRSAGFMDKHHYNLKSDDVDQALTQKSDLPYQKFVQKDR